MQVPSDEEIKRFFANITPEDFAKPPGKKRTVSRKISYVQEDEPRVQQGAEDFETFVLRHLQEFASSGTSSLVLHNGRSARTYTPKPDEGVASFVGRVRRQVARFGAVWVFVGVPGEASTTMMFDPSNLGEVAFARREGHMLQTLNWYAESIEPDSAEVRFGIVIGDGGDRQVVQSTYAAGVNPTFRRILDPTRRR